MQHYWTPKQILPRLGYSPKSSIHFKDYVQRHGIPAYKRRMPGKCYSVWYSNEALIQAYELAKCRHQRNVIVAEREAEYEPA